MEAYVKRMIIEHKELFERIAKLNNCVYGNIPEVEGPANVAEFTNKALQLKGMKIYEEALRARLENAGVVWEDGEYFEHVKLVKEGSDSDADKKDERKM